MGYFRHGVAFASNHFRPSYVRFASSKLKHTEQTSPQLNTPLNFAGLGLSRAVSLGLKSAYPDVVNATKAQATFIPAVIQGKDVMIKGHTGSGKSFGLALALLSKCWNPLPDGKRPLPTSLLLVPHRDLAYQYMHWIGQITTAIDSPHHSTPTQVIVRGQEGSPSQVSRLRENPPRILIGTPQAILDVLQEDKHAIGFTGLSTVVVDEVDSIIDFIPADASKDRKKKLAAKIRRHPSAGDLLLDRIHSSRVRSDGSAADSSPQLIVCSATLPTGLRQKLHKTSWFRKGTDSVVKVRSELRAGETRKSGKKTAAADVTLDAEVLQHCALVFSEDGSVRDVDGAHGEEGQTDIQDGDLPKIPFTEECTSTVKPCAFHPVLMEGIATIFATAVPKVALLVLPASAPVQRAVDELGALGINVFGLDVESRDRDGVEENPTLLVGTTATVRGIDLPDLSHVFIWGVLDGNSYLHTAGRVGRFGREGKVVTVLEERERESGRYLGMLKSIGLTLTNFIRRG